MLFRRMDAEVLVVDRGAHIRALMCVLVSTTRAFMPVTKEGIMEVYRVRTFAGSKEYKTYREAKEAFREQTLPCTLEQKVVSVWIRLDRKRICQKKRHVTF